MNLIIIIMEFRVAEQYRLVHKIGGGSFGEIYSAVDVTDNSKRAVKLEKNDRKPQQLAFEHRVYSLFIDEIGFPKIYHYGTEGDYNTLVMQLLGPSLEDLMKAKHQLTLLSVCLIAEQLLSRFEVIHSKSIIHRDVKPNNFLLDNNTIYVIDFGLAKRYRRFETRQHIQMKDGYGLVGTARYASIHAHLGMELSRRDDLESLGYLFVYLLKGSLPWQDLSSSPDGKYTGIGDMKMKIIPSELCNGLPHEFVDYLEYTKQLQFNEKPDYTALRSMFHNLLVTINPDKEDWHIESI
ncbi:casein kinase, putative [Entamoeba histolytica HM-3:IMSS]|nr:casein kinase, putative [Entamoeba histolytica HM-3:IMSS]